VVPRGGALGLAATQWATAVLYNGLSERAEYLGFSNWSLAELVENETQPRATRPAPRGANRIAG
jgi:hypothetical protein